MTNYYWGNIDAKVASKNNEYNTFRPNFQHYYYENYPSTYIEVEVQNERGEVVKKLYNIAKCMFKEDELAVFYNTIYAIN